MHDGTGWWDTQTRDRFWSEGKYQSGSSVFHTLGLKYLLDIKREIARRQLDMRIRCSAKRSNKNLIFHIARFYTLHFLYVILSNPVSLILPR